MASQPSFQSIRVLSALMIREMTTRYGRSWGGYIWAILEPVGMIAILSLAFSQFIKSPALGQSFVLFYATGYIPFHFFNETANTASSAISVNRSLLQFPKVTPLDAILARFLLSVLTLVVVAVVVFMGIDLLVEEQVRISLPELSVALLGAALLGLGVGTLNAVLFPFIPVWRRLWAIINRPLFLISGVFFTFESMPDAIQALLWFNPLVHVIGWARTGFYPTYDGSYVALWYVFGLGIGAFLLGAALLMRHRSFVIEND